MRTANPLQMGSYDEKTTGWARRLYSQVVRGRMAWVLAACGLLALPVSAVAVHGSGTGDDPSAGGSSDNAAKLIQSMTSHSADTHHISLEAQHSSSSTSQSHVSIQSTNTKSQPASATVNINGQSQQLAPGSRMHKTITDANGTTDVDISVDGSDQAAQSSGTTSTSSISVQINSSSASSGANNE